jgi:hypothetical protein
MTATNEAFPNALKPGTRIGPVVLDHPIGQGAWGIVYAGTHDVWGKVAVKEYFPSTYAARQSGGALSSSAPQWQEAVRRGLERFGQEGRALRAIRHENVVPVYEYLEHNGAAFLVMEFVEGGTLARALEGGRFGDPTAVMTLGDTLLDTLQAIHAKNILHRDIAPDNIMIRADGSPVLIDFGGAAAAIANATRSTQNIVKDGYSPPEQYDTSGNPSFPVGPWSDIYAAAAVLYRLAAGIEPAVSHTRLLASGGRTREDPLVPLTTLAPAGYPTQWLKAVDSALALRPDERPQKAVDWRERFAGAAKTAPSSNTQLLFAAAAGGLVTAVVAALAVFLVPRMTAPHAPAAAPVVARAAPAAPRPRPAVAAIPPRSSVKAPPGFVVMYDRLNGAMWQVLGCSQQGSDAQISFQIFNDYRGKMFYEVAVTKRADHPATNDWLDGRHALNTGASPTMTKTVSAYTCGVGELYAGLRNVRFNNDQGRNVTF